MDPVSHYYDAHYVNKLGAAAPKAQVTSRNAILLFQPPQMLMMRQLHPRHRLLKVAHVWPRAAATAIPRGTGGDELRVEGAFLPEQRLQ